jgi:hypothetical protein
MAPFNFSNVVPKALSAAKQGLRAVSRFAIGTPSEALKQFRSGTLVAKGGLLEPSVANLIGNTKGLGGKLNLALNVGLPAYGMYHAVTHPNGQVGSNVGGNVGALAGGTLGRPLGILGQLGGTTLLGNLGAHVGSMFDKKPGGVPLNMDNSSSYQT